MKQEKMCDKCGESFKTAVAMAREMNLLREADENPNVCCSCLLENDLNPKIFMAKSFLHSAGVLERILKAILLNEEEEKELSQEEIRLKEEDALCRKKYVIHFLYATVIELSIKVIWTSEKNKVAPRRHDILSLYEDLSDEQQQEIRKIYDRQVFNTEYLISQSNGQIDSLGKIVDIRPTLQLLEDMLKSNQQTMTGFKYDSQFNGKSSALSSIMWYENEIFLLPTPKLTIFPKFLLEYAISLKDAHSTGKSNE
jgi:HEPN domain-containing protein